MYGDEQPLQRLYRILMWSFPIGRPFGVHLRVYGAAAIVPLMAASNLWSIPGVSAAEVLTYAGLSTLALFAVVYTHEMGHVLMGRRHHIFTDRITLGPLGGVAHMQAAAPSPRVEILVSLAGPAVHILWLAVVWPARLWLAGSWHGPTGWHHDPLSETVWWLYALNLSLMLFNLLPFFPLDGGRVFRSLLALRMNANRATIWATNVGTVGAVGFLVYGFFGSGIQGGILAAIGLSMLLTCRAERMLARYGDGPYGEPRQPWEADPEGWRYGGGASDDRGDRGSRPGFFSRWKTRFARKPRPVAPPPIAPDDAELDRLLEKVGEVGISALTKSERAALLRASESRRH